jgi:hypothetical protein
MGHTRLGDIPRTRAWRDVVALIAGGAGASQIANATISAAERGLNLASNDKALVETVFLLSQLPLAARTSDFAGALRQAGLNVPDTPGLMDVVGAFSEAIDAKLKNGSRSDLGEMAQMAAAETITRFIGEKTHSLFGVTGADVQGALSQMATNVQFSHFARTFFSQLTTRCMDYFLSRAFSYHIGEGKRFATLAQQARFNEALNLHCREASKIVEQFSGGWFSKTNWEMGGISRREAAGFAHVAMQKVVSELKAGARSDA